MSHFWAIYLVCVTLYACTYVCFSQAKFYLNYLHTYIIWAFVNLVNLSIIKISSVAMYCHSMYMLSIG